VSTTFTGLEPSTYYCWRQVVNYSTGGTSSSAWISFETNPFLGLMLFPSVADSSTSAVTTTSAMTNATVSNENEAGTVSTQLGTQVSGSCSTPANVQSAGTSAASASVASLPVDTGLSGLQAGTGYCWRDVFSPAGGSAVDGSWVAFNTPALGGGAAGGSAAGGGSTPPPPSAFSDLSLPGVQYGDSFAVRLTVGSGGSTIAVTATAPAAQAAKSAKHKPKPVVLAQTTRSGVAAGPLKLSVSLNTKGKRALAAHHRLTLTVTIKVTPPGGVPLTNTQTITLRPPKAARKK
jgi:hypothetical protein